MRKCQFRLVTNSLGESQNFARYPLDLFPLTKDCLGNKLRAPRVKPPEGSVQSQPRWSITLRQ
jgi:hypothetical protein